ASPFSSPFAEQKLNIRRAEGFMQFQHSPKFLAVLFIVLGTVQSLTAQAATLPAGFTETQISGISSPTAMGIAPDGRIFVCQQSGSLRVIKNGVLLATPFMTLS